MCMRETKSQNLVYGSKIYPKMNDFYRYLKTLNLDVTVQVSKGTLLNVGR